jgi:regulator of sigma E protease
LGLCILAAGWLTEYGTFALENWVFVLEVAAGLGFVIFVHELGHFAVAKACGVKCEKFYLGFDIYGLRICRFQWGETEYGIGILPLGGYVKMLGQDDNPARAAEERERAMLHPDGDATALSAGALPQAEATAVAPAPVQLDPRSYVAKSVPQRMAIISAGVIMNLIFGVIMASIAYYLGVKENPCAISAVLPGEAAWKADMRPGDRIVKIGDESSSENLRFRDLQAAVMFSDPETGVRFKIKRDGIDEPFWLTVKPDTSDKARLRPTIGAVPARTTKLDKREPAVPGSVAGEQGKFAAEDTIVAVAGKPVADYAQFVAQLADHAEDPLEFTVERKEGSEETFKVPPQPRRVLGLQMQMGKITAVQADSPAAKEGLQADDFILTIAGEPPGDPLTLPERLRELAKEGQPVSIKISRTKSGEKEETLEKAITLRDPQWYEEPRASGSPMSAPALGIAYKVLNIVHTTEPESPAAAVELQLEGKPATAPHFLQGDQIVKADLISSEAGKELEAKVGLPRTYEFSAEKPNWPFFISLLQWTAKDTKVKLTLADGRTAEITPVDSKDWFDADRGLGNEYETTKFQAESPAQALVLGATETKNASLLIYRFLSAVGTGRVSAKNFGGPVSIFGAAIDAARSGPAQLLLFLTMLSANLAVINFLPIPLLDGGHMVFLFLEGIMGRPVSERVVVAVHYLGFIFIISLMLFVLGLDFHLIPRH